LRNNALARRSSRVMKEKSYLMRAIHQKIFLSGRGEALVDGRGRPITPTQTARAGTRARPGA